jgi:hypothetical protein
MIRVRRFFVGIMCLASPHHTDPIDIVDSSFAKQMNSGTASISGYHDEIGKLQCDNYRGPRSQNNDSMIIQAPKRHQRDIKEMT